jgi:hypothetical protein
MAGLSGEAVISVPESSLRAGSCAAPLGLVEDRHVAGRRGRALAHLGRGLVERHDPRPGGRDEHLRHHEGLAVEPVEAPRERPHELEVLALVLAYGDEVRVVQQDVGGLQDGVVVEPRARRLRPALPRLVLELRHAGELADLRHAVKEPRQLRVARTRLWRNTTDFSGSIPDAR